MKNTLIIILLAALFTGCKKDDKTKGGALAASFTFSHNTADVLRLPTTDTTMLISAVSNASAFSWDLGDGRKSTDSKLVLSYPKSGTYKVTLTAKASNGKTTSISKSVTVLDRVLKTIVIDKVYWNTTDPEYAQAGWPLTNTADLYVKIQLLQGQVVYKGGFAPDAPVVYTSQAIANIPSSTTTPYTFHVSQKVVLDKELLADRKYLISLIAKNKTGEYVLFSNQYSGSSQMVTEDSFSHDTFTVNTFFFSSLILNLEFE